MPMCSTCWPPPATVVVVVDEVPDAVYWIVISPFPPLNDPLFGLAVSETRSKSVPVAP